MSHSSTTTVFDIHSAFQSMLKYFVFFCSDLHEGSILFNMKKRYRNGFIYVSMSLQMRLGTVHDTILG